MKNKTKYIIILILMILATISSAVLSFIPIQKACGNSGSCLIVQTSKYEDTFGIKNSDIGLIAFPLLGILTLFELRKSNKYRKRLITLGIILGSLFAIYFLYLQIFVLKAICKYCLVVDIGVLIALGIVFIEEEEQEGKL